MQTHTHTTLKNNAVATYLEKRCRRILVTMTAIRIIIHIPSQGRMLANANRKERKSEKPPATKNKDTQILATRKKIKMSPATNSVF
jgi:hypothetical protein